jgi:hypothetical protein
MLRNNYTIGSDPELFLFNKKTKKVVSAIEKIPGCKEEPFREGLPEGFGLQTDNILAEFNVPPVTNEESWVANIEFMKDFIRSTAQAIDENFDILCQASSKVPLKELKHPQAKEFGCDPDFCIYTAGPNEVGKAAKTSLRSAGFHIHVGYPENNIDTSVAMLHYIDAIVGLPSILYDTDVERRNLYGKAGCFRLQPYGFEYRTLSSFWIANPSRLRFIWKQVMYALYAYECGYNLPDYNLTRSTINNNDVETAKALIAEFNLLHPKNVNPE